MPGAAFTVLASALTAAAILIATFGFVLVASVPPLPKDSDGCE